MPERLSVPLSLSRNYANPLLIKPGNRPQPKVVRALSDEQADGAIALQLQRQGSTKLQRRCQEHGSGNRLPQQFPDGLGVIRMRAQLAPSRIQAHPMAPNRPILHDKPTDL